MNDHIGHHLKGSVEVPGYIILPKTHTHTHHTPHHTLANFEWTKTRPPPYNIFIKFRAQYVMEANSFHGQLFNSLPVLFNKFC